MKAIFFTLVPMLVTLNVFAWGNKGHSIVGEIAQRHLHWSTQIALKKIAGNVKLADMANWADFVRSDKNYSKAAYWHYVTINDGLKYSEIEKDPRGDVIEAIDRMGKIVSDKNATQQQRYEALKFLVHFIGDIHQPLHVGRSDDRGGNNTKVKFFGKDYNLHQIWDEVLIDFQNISFTEYANRLDIADKKTLKKWKREDINVWVQESMDLRPMVYDIGEEKNLGYDYNFKNIQYVNLRLYQAGIRLAATLDRLLTLL